MDYKRLFIIFILALSGTLLLNAWEKEHHQVLSSAPSVNQTGLAPELLSASDDNEIKLEKTTHHEAAKVIVKTDVLDVAIDPVGGIINNAKLLKYSQSLQASQDPITLLNDTEAYRYTADSGLVSKDGPTTLRERPTYTTTVQQYSLKPQEKTLTVDLHWQNAQGLNVIKRFVFHRNSYVIDVNYLVENKTNQAWQGHFYGELIRKNTPPPRSGLFGVSSYFGASVSTENKSYQKVSFNSMQKKPLSAKSQGGWVAMQQHYFLTAWIPDSTGLNHYFSKVLGDDTYGIGMTGPKITVNPNEKTTVKATLYVGPELPKILDTVAPHLGLTIDYGWLWFISLILFWLMNGIYFLVGNWGWAIVGVTLLIKVIFYRLSAASYGSMAAMRSLQPKLEALKEKFGDDKQQLSQATFELYKKEKINPLGGCLPILIQIPVFIALYWVLIESVELRQAPFILWIHDLSVKDPYYILPIIMGITMFLQQRLTPASPDPMQARVMYVMPIIFTALFLNFPAGLVLYWIVNNSLSILQQWYIMRNHGNTQLKSSSKKTKK